MTSDIFFFFLALFSCLWVSFVLFLFLLFFATENLSQTCLYEAERREHVWRTVGVRANECACMMGARVLACLRAELVNTFLGTKLPRPVLWGNVQKKQKKNKTWGLARKRNPRTRASGSCYENTRVKEVSVSVRGCCSIQRCLKQPEEETHHKHQLTHSG